MAEQLKQRDLEILAEKHTAERERRAFLEEMKQGISANTAQIIESVVPEVARSVAAQTVAPDPRITQLLQLYEASFERIERLMRQGFRGDSDAIVEELQRAQAEQARLAGELLVFQEQFKIEHASWLEAWHVQQGAMEELRRQLAEQKALAENAKGAANHIPTREEREAQTDQPLPQLVAVSSSQPPPPPPGGGAAVGVTTQEPNGNVAQRLQLMTGVTSLVAAPRQKQGHGDSEQNSRGRLRAQPDHAAQERRGHRDFAKTAHQGG